MIAHFFHHNQAAKLGSFLVAIGVWLFAISGATRTALFPGTIPLTMAHVPDQLMATANVDVVRVRLAADPTVWRQLTPSMVTATVDLAGQPSGVSDLPVKLTVAAPNVQVIEVLPRTVEVRLEPKVTRDKSIEVTTTGEPASGFFPSEATSDPATVTVSGGQSVVDQVDHVTAVISVADATTDRDETVAVQALDGAGHPIVGLTFSLDHVHVHQPLTKLAASKTVGVRVATTGAPPSGKLVVPTNVQPATVTVAGSAATLAGVTSLTTKPIDLSSVNQSTTVHAALDMPNGVTLVSGATVDVSLNVTDRDATLAVVPKLTFTGLASGHQVVAVTPAAPTVVVRGPAGTLNSLGSGDVTLTVDLTGQGPGTTQVSVSSSGLRLPDGVNVQQLITTSVAVTIQ